MTGFALAWRTAKRYRARALLAVTGVAVIGALNFDMLLLSRGLLLSFADMLASAGFDVRVVGGTGIPMLRAGLSDADRLAEEIKRLPEVEHVALVRFDQAIAIGPDRREREITFIGTTETAARGGWRLVRGADLTSQAAAGPPPVVVAEELAALYGLEPGSTLRVRLTLPNARSALPPIDCLVVGIAEFSVEAIDEFTVATTIEAFDAAHGSGATRGADLILAASRAEAGPDWAVDAIAKLRPNLRVYSNEQMLAQFNQNGFAYFRQLSLVLSTTTAVFTFLLVATLLTVSVNQRLGEIAALRALGIAQRRVAAMLLWESALLVGLGGAASLPLGGVLAIGLDTILRRMPGLPDRLHFFVFEPRALVLHGLLLGSTAIVAALYPVWLAVRLPIAETLRREVVS